jgi:hypothetical protein
MVTSHHQTIFEVLRDATSHLEEQEQLPEQALKRMKNAQFQPSDSKYRV